MKTTNPRPLRVLQLIDHMGAGGAQDIVHEVARRLHGNGFEVELAHLFGPNHFLGSLIDAGIPVHDLSTGASYSPRAVLDPRLTVRLRRVLVQGNYDAVHVHLYGSPLHLTVARQLLSPNARPYVFNTVHAHRIHLPRYIFPSYRLTRRTTTAWVAEVPSTVPDLQAIGVDSGDIVFIPFGVTPVDPVENPESLLATRKRYGIPADAFVLLSVARLHPQRRIDRLLESFAQFVREGSGVNAVFLIIGEGEQRGELEQRVTELGVADRVTFGGETQDLPGLFGLADLYLGVSIEGDVSVAPRQAMSAGLPCLAWEFSGGASSVEALDDRILAPCEGTVDGHARMLTRLHADSDLRGRVAKHGCQQIRTNRTASAMAAAYAQLYRERVRLT